MSNAARLIVGHGTRDPEGVAQFQQLVSALQAAQPTTLVAGCYLELQAPSIAEAIDGLAAQGVAEIHLAPALLFAAGHALRDIPAEIAAARRRHPELDITQAEVLGCHPRLLELSARRYDESLEGGAPVDIDNTLALLVGRGSLEASATAEMQRFARLRAELRPAGRYEVAFLAMAEPNVDAALEAAGQAGLRRVVVQPHLLFAGDLSRRLADRVEAARRDHPAIDWRLAAVLGPERELVEALTDSPSHTPPLTKGE